MTSPRWARALLARTLPPEDRESVLGDLEEMHRRRLLRLGPARAAFVTGGEAVVIALAFARAGLAERVRRVGLGGPELRLAVRFLARTPLLTVTAFLALAVGLGLGATTFTVVQAVLHPELPWPGGDRFVEVLVHAPPRVAGEEGGAVPPGAGEPARRPVRDPAAYRGDRPPGHPRSGGTVPAPTLDEVASSSSALLHLSEITSGDAMVRGPEGGAALARRVEVPPELLEHLPWLPLVGRLPTEGDRPVAGEPARVALLGEALWERLFDEDPDVVGRTVEVAGLEVRVVGVLPRDADFPVAADLWVPSAPSPLSALPPGASARMVAVLSEGASPTGAEAYLRAALAGGPGVEADRALRVEVRRFGEGAGGQAEGAVLLALLLAFLAVVAGNVGNLMAARAAARRREIAVRTALGAGRGRVVAQLALEVALLTGAAAVVGLAASHLTLSAFAASEARDLPPWLDLGLRPGTVVFTVAGALLAALLAGVLPALGATRRNTELALRESARGTARSPFGTVHHALVALQVAAAVGVLGAAAVVYRGWAVGPAPSLPVPTDRVLVAQVAFHGSGGASGAEAPGAAARRSALEARLRALAGVEAVASASHLPGTDAPLAPVVVEGAPAGSEDAGSAPVARVGPGYFPLLGVGPLHGRLLDEEDARPGAPTVALVNASFVKQRLGGAAAVGRRIRLPGGADGGPAPWTEIVGVVPDLGMSGVDGRYAGGIYLPLGSEARTRILLRTTGRPAPLAPALQEAAAAVGPDVTLDAVKVLGPLLESLRRVYLLVGTGVLALGVLVLLLSLLGVYAILSFEVGRRTREIGIRLALGADRLRILGPVVRGLGRWVVGGMVVGTWMGLALAEVVRGTLVTRFPPVASWVFPFLWAAVLATALLAALVPLRRALAVTPARSLQAE